MAAEMGSAFQSVDLTTMLEKFDRAGICVANLLCDGHDPLATAYRIVTPEAVDIVTYGELREQSERFAAALAALGVQRGDRVATLMGKSRSYLVTLMGIWRLGAVHVPLFTAFAPPAIGFRLQSCNARLVVADAGQVFKLNPSEAIPENSGLQVVVCGSGASAYHDWEELMACEHPRVGADVSEPDSPLIHIFTSGTTGKPKGVVVPVRALVSVKAYADYALDLRADDLFWCAADPGWAYGLYFGVLASLLSGTESLLLEGGFKPEATLDVLAMQGVTNFAAAPTVYRAMRTANVASPAGIRLRCASSAGEPLTPEVNAWAVSALGVPVHDHYGQTETGMLINNHHHPLLRKTLKPGSMGQAMPGWTARILKMDGDEVAGVDEVGRVAFDLEQSPLAWFSGYYGDPEKSAEKFSRDGRWYLTGDTGWMDKDGYFYFSARDDDVIIMAGYRIGPFEIESVIASHNAVAECSVIAVPDAVRGEAMEAFVVLVPSMAESEELKREIQQWVKTGYAAHAYPRKVHFVQALPKTPSGKVQRFILKQGRLEQLAANNVAC